MKKTFTILSLLLFITPFVQGQIIFQEDFEGGDIPTDWMNQSDATDGGWAVGSIAAISSQNFGVPANGSNNVAGTNDDSCNCNKNEEFFITSAINLTDQTMVQLSFDVFYLDNTYGGIQEDASVLISLDGLTWELLDDLSGEADWVTNAYDLSDYAGEETVFIGFRYSDGGGWLYGFVIDNIILQVPPMIEVKLEELDTRIYGEIGNSIPIAGTVYNAGLEAITSMEVTYTIDGANPVSELLDGIDIPSLSFYNFDLPSSWMPDAAGIFAIAVEITAVNGGPDENPADNGAGYDSEIFDAVDVPNKIDEILESIPVLTEMVEAAANLNKPTDLDFFPILGKDELWIINQRTESAGGSTLTISDATGDPSNFWHRIDGNSWHFMSLPTAIEFSPDNYNFGSAPGVQDANHGGGSFTGPTLWSSHPDIYAQPSGGNGSHLDMLHGSPFSMGITHEVDNVFWIYDDWNKDLVRYDFVDDHGPGNDYHADALVRRYSNIGIDADGDIPSHMIMDKSTGWLYFVDNGNDRVMRLDINSATNTTSIPEINEALTEHSRMTGFTTETIINEGLDRPCGIEIFGNRLMVGDYATGDIHVYDMENDFAYLGNIPTLEAGLTGIKVGPDGNIWYVNRIENTLKVAEPGEPNGTRNIQKELEVKVIPNPTTGLISIDIPSLEFGAEFNIQVQNATGQTLISRDNAAKKQELDLTNLPNGVYFVHLQGDTFFGTKRVVIQR